MRDSFGGAAWCVTSTSIIEDDVSIPALCVGCEDGTVKVFRYDSNGLEYVRALPTGGNARILAVAACPKASKHDIVNASVYVGSSAGFVHCINRTTGTTNIYMCL